jgi:beta-glucosidase
LEAKLMKWLSLILVLLFFKAYSFASEPSSLSLREKLGQVTQPDVQWITPEQVRDYNIGSVLRGGGTLAEQGQFPSDSINGPQAWAQMVQKYKFFALQSSSKLPLLFAIDAVHGHNNVTGATLYPHNIGLGASRDFSLVEQIGTATAQEILATGIDWNFSPTLAVAGNERWGRTYESFSENTDLVSQMGAAYLRGLQKPLGQNSIWIAGTAKHWIGDGGTAAGVDQGDTQLSLTELRKTHLPPYLEAIRMGVPTVMASFNSWNGKKLHEHKFLITDLLKTELKFDGLVVSDWNGIEQISTPPGLSDDDKYMLQIAKAFDAGVDVFMVPENWAKFIELSEKLIENFNNHRSPSLDPARLDDAVQRVLNLKKKLRLNQRPLPLELYAEFSKDFGSPSHRSLAARASGQSAVLLISKISTLISSGDHVLVVGEKAILTGPQAGGWSLNWQGVTDNIPGSESIFDGINAKSAIYGLRVTYSSDSLQFNKADKIVLVLGEQPYAEGQGDRPGEGPRLSEDDELLLNKAVASGRPVILILLSGRPILLPESTSQVSALISYWLPGTMGSAIADYLLGEKKFNGRLPFSWPKNKDQLDSDYRDTSIDWLFPFGFGH